MITIVDFEDKYQEAFKELNVKWITKFFRLEQLDIITLNEPQKIIDDGGAILIALSNNFPVGVCALKKINNEKFELSKFAVSETMQGKGIGKLLMDASFKKAKELNANTLYLEGNTKLESSIHLYRKYGFKEIPLHESTLQYERVNIIMEASII